MDTPDALDDLVSRLAAALEHIEKSCLCERFVQKGFDYHEHHPRMGKCSNGRWLTPSDIARAALRDIANIRAGQDHIAASGNMMGEGENG